MLPLPRVRAVVVAALPAAALLLAVAGPISAAPPPRIAGRCADPIPDDELLCCAEDPVRDRDQVTVDTPLGAMVIELYSNVVPKTVTNLLGYIERGDYTDTIVHRVEPGEGQAEDFVIQAGGYALSGIFFEKIERQEPVVNEPCLSNVAGTVAMARLGGEIDSATSEWFVNLSDNLALDTVDEGFTVFGRVIAGLPVATDIVNLPDRLPATPIPILQAVIEGSTWSIFRSSPAVSEVSIDPGPHGCFDASQSGVLLAIDPQSSADLEPNEAHDLPFYLVSTACTGAAGDGAAPPIECDEGGRRVLLIDPDTGAFFPDPTAELGFAEVTLSCDAIVASDAGLDTRLNVITAQLDAVLVKTTYTVPEPSLPLATTASLLTLTGLACFRRRHDR